MAIWLHDFLLIFSALAMMRADKTDRKLQCPIPEVKKLSRNITTYHFPDRAPVLLARL